MYRVEILVVERLGLLIRNLAFFCNVPDVPLHGLAHIRKSRTLVDPLLGLRRVQRVLRLIAQSLLARVVPCFQPQRQQIIVRFRFVGFQDRFRVLPVLYRFRRRVSAQQHIHDLLVCVRQQIPALHLLEFLLLGLDLLGKLHGFLCRLRHAQLLLLALLRFLIAFRNADSFRKPLYGFIKVIPRPRLEALRLCAERFVQRLFALPDALRHLIELQELVARCGDARREQLRCHVPHLLIERVDRQSIAGKAQRAHGLLAEQVKVRNVRPVFRRDEKLLRADFLAHILVLLIVFRVGFPPGVPCLFKEPVQLRAVHLAAAQYIVDDLIGDWPQRLALGRLRHAQIVCQPPHQRILRPRHIFCRPLRQCIPEPLLCRRKLHLTGIVSLWIPLLLKVPKHIFRKNTLVRAVDSLQKICYTNFGSLDRAHALGLRVRLAAIFLSSADRVQHVIGFNSSHASCFLLHCYDCGELPSAAVRRIRSHRISTGNVLRLVFQCIDWNCIFDDISDHRSKPRIGQQAILRTIQAVPDTVCLYHQVFPGIPIAHKHFPVPFRTHGAGVFHALLHDLRRVDAVVLAAHCIDLRQRRHIHVRLRRQKIVGIGRAIFREVDSLVRLVRLVGSRVCRRCPRAAGLLRPLPGLHRHLGANVVRSVGRAVDSGIGVRHDFLNVGVRVVSVDRVIGVDVAVDLRLADLSLGHQPLADALRHLSVALCNDVIPFVLGKLRRGIFLAVQPHQHRSIGQRHAVRAERPPVDRGFQLPDDELVTLDSRRAEELRRLLRVRVFQNLLPRHHAHRVLAAALADQLRIRYFRPSF